MRIIAIFLAVMFLLPGCTSDDEKEITFHGRDLAGSDTYKFTLESADGDLWSLEEQRGKVVILVFMFTRCDETCPVTSQNVKMVQETLSDEELEKISETEYTAKVVLKIGPVKAKFSGKTTSFVFFCDISFRYFDTTNRLACTLGPDVSCIDTTLVIFLSIFVY